MSNGNSPGQDAYDRQAADAAESEYLFRKTIEDEWHALRVTLQHRPAPEPELYRILCAQQVILESLYYLRTGRRLQP